MNNESRFPTWAWGIIGAVTILAASILIISVVLGIQAGQQQIEIQRRQQIGIALQQATDAQAEGNLQAALDAYQKVLVLDPSNDIAQLGIKNLLTLAQGGAIAAGSAAGNEQSPLAEPAQDAQTAGQMPPARAAAGTATAGATAQTAGAVTPAATVAPAPTNQSQALSYWDAAQVSVSAGRWQEALVNLTSLQRVDPLYRSDEVADLLYQTYTSLAVEQENQDSLEGALQYYEKALLLRPDAVEAQRERKLIMSYLDVLTYSDADWPRAIELLETLYTEDPQYRDVEARLQDAHAAYADQLAEQQQWCLALDEYESALSVRNQVDLAQKRNTAQLQCDQVGNLALGVDASGRTTTTSAVTGGVTSAVTGPVTDALAGAMTGVTPAATYNTGGGPAIGRILYSSNDTVTGGQMVMQQGVGKDAPAQQLLQDAAQPALRADGTRLAFHNQRGNMGGISSYDPDTGLMLRFSQYAEDSAPSWNPQGSRVAFASRS